MTIGIRTRLIRTRTLISAAVGLAMAAMTVAASAQDQKPVVLPPSLNALRMPVVESPDAFVDRHLQQYRLDLELFEALLDEKGEPPIVAPDIDKLLQAGEKNLPQTVILSGSIQDDAHLTPPEPFDLPPSAIFIDKVVLKATGGALHGGNLFAADRLTAAALNLPTVAGITAFGDATFVFFNKKVDGCCAKVRRDKNNRIICLRKHKVPTIERRKNIDLRGMFGTKINFKGLGNTVKQSGIAGVGVKPQAGRHQLRAIIDVGREPKTSVQCAPLGKQAVSFKPSDQKRIDLSLNVVQLLDFGIGGLDTKFTPGGKLVSTDYFGPAGGNVRIKSRSTAGQLRRINGALGKVNSADGATKLQSIFSTVRELNAGPFTVNRRGVISLPRRFRPGASRIRWRLKGGVGEKIHTLRANRYDVEVDPEINAGRMIEGREYFVRIVVEGPSSLAKHTIDWGGDVAWKGNPSFERDGKISTAENTFTLGVENQFPDLEISMSGPDGEVFTFKRGIKVAGEAVQGLQLFASKGLISEPRIIRPALDFFFPTSDGLSAMLARFSPQISTPRGVFDIFQVDVESPVVKEHQRQSGKVIAIDNPNIIVGGGRVNIRPGFAEFQVAPAINEATVAALVGGPSIDPGNNLGFPGGKALISKPIKLTVNSVRLLRRGGGL